MLHELLEERGQEIHLVEPRQVSRTWYLPRRLRRALGSEHVGALACPPSELAGAIHHGAMEELGFAMKAGEYIGEGAGIEVAVFERSPTSNASALLHAARDAFAESNSVRSPLVWAVEHLIDCAAAAMTAAEREELNAARESLAAARAAVVCATYAVREFHGMNASGHHD